MIPLLRAPRTRVRVRGLADRGFADMRGPPADLVGRGGRGGGRKRENGARPDGHDDGAGLSRRRPRDASSRARSTNPLAGLQGFAWLAIAHDYPIKSSVGPSAATTSHGLVERDSLPGRAGQFIGSRGGRQGSDIRHPADARSGADLCPGSAAGCICASAPIDTAKPARTPGSPAGTRRQNRTQRARRQSLPTCSDCARTTRIGTWNPFARGRAVRWRRPRQRPAAPGRGR